MLLWSARELSGFKRQAGRQRRRVKRGEGGAGGAYVGEVRQLAAAAVILLLAHGIKTEVAQQMDERRLLRADQEQGAEQDYGDGVAAERESHRCMITKPLMAS